MLKALSRHTQLTWAFTRRDLVSKHKGLFLGGFWSFAKPMFMLAIYTVVFSKIMQVKLGEGAGTAEFALYLFCGLIPWLAFSDAVNRSTTVIMNNVNLVRKVIFPLEILPVSMVFSDFLNSLFSLFILLLGLLALKGYVYWTFVFYPLVFLPLLLFTQGLSWMVACVGVAVKDLREAVGMVLTAWMFLTPIVYPASLIPEKYLFWAKLNPMFLMVDNFRRTLLYGQLPDFTYLLISLAQGGIIFLLGHLAFQRFKKLLAEVV